MRMLAQLKCGNAFTLIYRVRKRFHPLLKTVFDIVVFIEAGQQFSLFVWGPKAVILTNLGCAEYPDREPLGFI